MKRLVLLLALVALPAVAFGQNRWSHSGAFPDSLRALGSGHGVAVDPDGKVWFQPFGGTLAITFPDTVIVNGTKRKTLNANQIYVYNPDGTPASFSPITYLANAAGVRVDTLGYFYSGMAPATSTAPARQRFETRSGRGLRAGNDGNIYASQFNTVYRINYKTGALMGVARDIYGANPITAVAVDGFGNVYTAAVAQAAGRPIRIYSDDLTTVLNPSAVTMPAGFSRTLEVNADGTRLYWAGFTTNAIHLYKRASEQDPFVQTPDTLLKGFASESVTIHPVNKALWVSAGSTSDVPNRFPTFRAPYTYQIQTWYAFDQTQLSATNPNPAPLDSIKWNGGGIGRPRGLAFNPAGNVAYVTNFSQPAPGPYLQKFTFSPVGVEPVDGVPAGFALQGSYPNPFRGETRVRFSLDQASHVSLKVYDVIGREVATLVDETLAAGGYASPFDGANLPAGTYFYRLSARGRTLSGAMTLAK